MERTVTLRSANWLLPVCAGLCAAIVFLALNSSTLDIVEFLYIIIVAIPLFSLIGLCALVIYAFRKKKLPKTAVLLILPVYWAMTWVLIRNGDELREREKWLLRSRSYKAHVLALPSPPNGELKHVFFDGWGFVPAGNTDVYLIYDPSETLRSASQSRVPVRATGIPCEVPFIWRLEPGWYAVEFYTNEGWESCG